MICSSDIANILVRDAKTFGVEVYQKGNLPVGEVATERITVSVEEPRETTYWEKCYANVNICVPNLDGKGNANLLRLQDYERKSKKKYKSVLGNYDGSWYEYGYDTISIEEDERLSCHYVNVRILFKVLNVT